jgi:hypothetical protein
MAPRPRGHQSHQERGDEVAPEQEAAQPHALEQRVVQYHACELGDGCHEVDLAQERGVELEHGGLIREECGAIGRDCLGAGQAAAGAVRLYVKNAVP